MAFDFENKPFEEHQKWPVKKIITGFLLVAVVIGLVFVMRNAVLGTGAATVIPITKSAPDSLAGINISATSLPILTQTVSSANIPYPQLSSLLGMVLDLHQAYQKKNIIDSATLVTDIDSVIKRSQNSALSQSWETLTLCLSSTCSDVSFLEFIRVLSSEGGKNGQLILDFITADKYWNTENTIRFSEAVTNVNTEVELLNKTNLVSAWKNIVDCAGTCVSKTSIMFGFLEELR